ncbi:hypothetical protein Cenrod_1037 [Candidatus Symbiobacter mobilis CR]|uniref:Uncharacterized protein n=1 Tax=Candidatus Symbiobacter mobilis CR TaxID=946483 RepID=U5N754_9BURK|nr:hypothetical protein Cenrod_1037 [Candidatus Symbiobacter mobilis CR]
MGIFPCNGVKHPFYSLGSDCMQGAVVSQRLVVANHRADVCIRGFCVGEGQIWGDSGLSPRSTTVLPRYGQV